MRILLVNTRHFRSGGDSVFTLNLAELLRNHSHDVAFFAMEDSSNISDPNEDLFVPPIDFRYLNQKKSLGSAFKVLGRVIYYREARTRFSNLLDRVQPDIVHLQSIHGHISPSIIFEARKRKLPIVWTLHDYKLICPNTLFINDATGTVCEACGRNAYYQPVLRRCKKGSLLASSMAALEAYAHQLMQVRKQVDAFITPSQFLWNKLIDRGFNPLTVHHVPHFVPHMPEISEDQKHSPGYVLFLGRLEAIKGISVLIEASRLVPDISVIVAGPLNQEASGRLLNQFSKNAVYVGMKSGDELASLLRGASAVVLPSICYENQPMSILEAFSYGKPVVASDLGGMSELVANEERGLLFQPGSPNALADAMRRIMDYPEDSRKMGLNGRAFVLEHHTEKHHYELTMALYQQLLAEKAGGAKC